MADKISAGPICGSPSIKEAVCISTKKVYDSCKYRDCQQDMRVYLTRSGQEIIDRAVTVKARCAELVWTYIDVEAVPFNKGFYTVDVRYFYKITADAYFGTGRPCEVKGLSTFDKRMVLFGSEGSVRIFSSKYKPGEQDIQTYEKTNMPTAVIEVVDPILLSLKLVENECGCAPCNCALHEVPDAVCRCFDDDIILSEEGKKLYATIGQFAIMRLERDIQLLIPAYDICMPCKECNSDQEDPCCLFEKFAFPVDEFFPPKYDGNLCGCGMSKIAESACNQNQSQNGNRQSCGGANTAGSTYMPNQSCNQKHSFCS